MGDSQFEKEKRERRANAVLGATVVQSVIAGLAILLIAWLTDINIWVVVIVVFAILAATSYFSAAKRL